MDLKKWEPVVYPMTVWLVFKILAFAFGFSSWPNIARLALLGETYPFISAFGFGLWIGAASQEGKLSLAIRNAIMVAFLIGFVELLLTIILINSSPSFIAYVISRYPADAANESIPLINLVISTWIGGMFVIVPAAAASYFLMGRKNRR